MKTDHDFSVRESHSGGAAANARRSIVNPAGRTVLYDAQQDRLVVTAREATPDFWDRHWRCNTADTTALAERLRKKWPSDVVRSTRPFLRPEHGVILEGGCGCAHHVAALQDAGYTAIGIDYAPHTIDAVRRARPDLDVRLGDVRALQLEPASCVGYWSVGVIEHFWEGYAQILSEMHRVLAPGGMLFLCFPCVSPVRRAAIRRGAYPPAGGTKPENFYQFILNPQLVARDLHAYGFELLNVRHKNFRDGARQEAPGIALVLDRVERRTSGTRTGRRAWHYADRMLTRLLAWYYGHSVCLTARKRNC